ncbi:Uma2 family endonuclease [Myxococcota bacterium]|nr:Uma2 family endonuclease [Myxococcota bacterium]
MPRAPRWVVDPSDPRAPPMDVWVELSPRERAAVVAALPSEFPPSEAQPPEGDAHFNAKVDTKSTLRRFFSRTKRSVYLACELPVYYPGERMFAPDLIAVCDVDATKERERWVVAAEGRGLDLALEVHVAGDRRKDLVRNAERYARLGVREYFIFDRGQLRLTGYSLPDGGSVYETIVPQVGLLRSEVLDLELGIDGARLRFFSNGAPVLGVDEWTAKLEGMVEQIDARAAAAEERIEEERQRRKRAQRKARAEQKRREEEQKRREEEQKRREEEQKRREEEQKRREEEQKRREDVEARLAAALAELERLKRGT